MLQIFEAISMQLSGYENYPCKSFISYASHQQSAKKKKKLLTPEH